MYNIVKLFRLKEPESIGTTELIRKFCRIWNSEIIEIISWEAGANEEAHRKIKLFRILYLCLSCGWRVSSLSQPCRRDKDLSILIQELLHSAAPVAEVTKRFCCRSRAACLHRSYTSKLLHFNMNFWISTWTFEIHFSYWTCTFEFELELLNFDLNYWTCEIQRWLLNFNLNFQII